MEPRTRKYFRRYRFFSFARNLSKKYWATLLKTASKKLVYKTAEATEELIGNNICDKIVKSMSDINSRNTE